LGLGKQHGKERIWVKPILGENIWTFSLITGGSLRLLCFGNLSNFPNDKQVEQFCVYMPDNYINAYYTFPPSVWSEFTASLLRAINTCELFHAPFKTLFYSSHHNIFCSCICTAKNTE
jgi:hypothetical protein